MSSVHYPTSLSRIIDRDFGDNPPMPKTSKEKQEDFRARNAMLGLTEVRGIYLPPDLHAELKEQAAKLLKKHNQEAEKKARTGGA